MNYRSLICVAASLVSLTIKSDGEDGGREIWCVLGSGENRAAAKVLIDWRGSVAGGDFRVLEISRREDVPTSIDYLLILGDEDEIPPKKLPFYRWMATQQERYASDLDGVDFDKDGFPDAAVGRIPTSVPGLIQQVAEKIVRYEKAPARMSDLELPVWMGSTDIGTAFDEFATFAMQRALFSQGPSWADLWLLMGNPRDTFSAHGNRQDALFNRQIARGGVFSFFMGHGARDWFYSYSLDRESYGYSIDAAFDAKGEPAPPAVIFACDCGDFAEEKTSLAEAMLFSEGGPVAVVAATTQSHPLTNYYSGRTALNQLRAAEHRRLGDFWNAVQKDASGRKEIWAELALSGVEGMLENDLDVGRLKWDHTMMYALTGDPATKLRLPEALSVFWEKLEDGRWRWTAEKPTGRFEGELIVSYRAVAQNVVRALPENAGAEESLRLFEERNRTLDFVESGRMGIEDEWTGIVAGAGVWRVVFLTGEGLFVAAKRVP